jgi:hypothetical protein
MASRKCLTIFQENNSPIIMVDEDDRDLSEYSKELSSFMTLDNISIIETSNSAAIIRPSKISSILVEDVDVTEEEPKPEKPPIKIPGRGKNKPAVKKKEVDIITDVD